MLSSTWHKIFLQDEKKRERKKRERERKKENECEKERKGKGRMSQIGDPEMVRYINYNSYNCNL